MESKGKGIELENRKLENKIINFKNIIFYFSNSAIFFHIPFLSLSLHIFTIRKEEVIGGVHRILLR